MHISSLKVSNFKGFKHREFEFPERFTLIIGDNGSGKTSVIEALMTSMAFRLKGGQLVHEPIPQESFHLERVQQGNAVRFEPRRPHFQVMGTTFDRPAGILVDRGTERNPTVPTIEEVRSALGAIKQVQAVLVDAGIETVPKIEEARRAIELLVDRGTVRTPTEVSGKLFDDLLDSGADILPVIAGYSVKRLEGDRKSLGREPKPRTHINRRAAYHAAMSGSFAIAEILTWLRDEQYAALQEGQESVLFRTVTEAMIACLPGAKKIEYVIREYDVLVEFDDGTVQPFRNLSDGQRIMLWLVADIAYRAAWLNPQLEDRVLQETDGIVLIDEIDLHLHPKWQRHVVDDLKRTFPKIQFIATSHSPFIIQSLQPGELLSLDGEPPIEYANRGLEEIARHVQGVEMPQTSQRYIDQKAAARRYFTLLREGRTPDDVELETAKAALDEFTAHFADNPAADAFLELRRQAQAGSGT